MRRRTEIRKIREISEGNYNSIHASNKAEKFKFSKLAQGIESCRNAQVQKYRKEEKELRKTLEKINLEKSKHLSEEEQFFCDYSPGDGIGMISFCDLSTPNESGDEDKDEELDDSSNNSVEEDQDIQLNVNKVTELKESEDEDGVISESPERGWPNRRSSLKTIEFNSNNNHFPPAPPSAWNWNGSDPVTSYYDTGRRSSGEMEEATPFYLKKKYDHHWTDKSKAWTGTAMRRRRNALTLEDEMQLREWQSKLPSADLDTITFKTSKIADRRWLSTDIKREREKAVKRQSTANMEMSHQHRPNSGLRRISMALQRMPSDESPRDSVHSAKSIKSSVRNVLSPKPTPSVNLRPGSFCRRVSEIRKCSLPAGSGSGLFTAPSKERLQLSMQRRHTLGDLIHLGQLGKKNSEIKDFKSMQDLSPSTEPVLFNDKGMVYPAFHKNHEHTLKEFISLRKCRYLRLSKLNWESLQWQSKHKALLNI
eukprot:gene9649-10637_t